MDFRTALDQSGADPKTAQAAADGMNAILARSATDRAFRQKLVADPRAALAEYKGVSVDEIPAGVNMLFVETNGVPTVVLPDYVPADGQLSESELETVSGGTTVFCLGVIVGILIAT